MAKPGYFRAKFVPSILENGKRGILIMLDDITEVKQYQRDLEKTVQDKHERTYKNIDEPEKGDPQSPRGKGCL